MKSHENKNLNYSPKISRVTVFGNTRLILHQDVRAALQHVYPVIIDIYENSLFTSTVQSHQGAVCYGHIALYQTSDSYLDNYSDAKIGTNPSCSFFALHETKMILALFLQHRLSTVAVVVIIFSVLCGLAMKIPCI